MPDTNPDDRRADALAESLRNACADYPVPVVIDELICALGEAIGLYPLNQRAMTAVRVGMLLRQYVAEIPPLPSDAYPGPDHAA